MRLRTIPQAALFLFAPLASPSGEQRGSPAGAVSAERLPWKTGVPHRFVWIEGSEKVGETVFEVRETGEGAERAYEIRTRRTYDKSPTSMRSKSLTVVRADGSPVRFEETLDVVAAKGFRARLETTIAVAGGKARAKYVHNAREELATLNDYDLPPDAFLSASQAAEHWAVFASKIPREKREATLRVFYPDFKQVYDVRFRAEGRDTLRVGGTPTEAEVYTFSTPEGQLRGTLWLDAERRLVQIEFPPRSPDAKSLKVVLASGD
ncbi:MAG: DUF6134 family protein [Planctomycetota bacterium]